MSTVVSEGSLWAEINALASVIVTVKRVWTCLNALRFSTQQSPLQHCAHCHASRSVTISERTIRTDSHAGSSVIFSEDCRDDSGTREQAQSFVAVEIRFVRALFYAKSGGGVSKERRGAGLIARTGLVISIPPR